MFAEFGFNGPAQFITHQILLGILLDYIGNQAVKTSLIRGIVPQTVAQDEKILDTGFSSTVVESRRLQQSYNLEPAAVGNIGQMAVFLIIGKYILIRIFIKGIVKFTVKIAQINLLSYDLPHSDYGFSIRFRQFYLFNLTEPQFIFLIGNTQLFRNFRRAAGGASGYQFSEGR